VEARNDCEARRDGIIAAVLRPLPLVLLIFATVGCEFWNPPDPPDLHNEDGVLRCGDVEILTGYSSGQTLDVDIATGIGVELRLDLSDPSHSARLAVLSGGGLDRLLEIWDSVTGERLISGTRSIGEDLTLELIATNAQLLSGTVSVTCQSTGEVCFNLGDDDGDGAVDCADISCARSPGCVNGQEDLETVVLECSDTLQPLTPPVLSAISDQRTLYATSPGGDAGPAQEFWGGAEIAIYEAEAAGTIEIQTETDALVCAGLYDPQVVLCPTPIRLAAGESTLLSTDDLPLWLEPVGPRFEAISVRLDCD
jgi:hypothetical protein